MRITRFWYLLVAVLTVYTGVAQEKKFRLHTVAFYNLENLFDTINGPHNDEEYLPNRGWTGKKYMKKLDNLGRVIPQIGTSAQHKDAPVLVGVSEVETRGALEDLVKNHQMASFNYGIVHYDSPDRRGIDVALLYRKKHFVVTNTKSIPLMIYNDMESKKKSDANAEDDQPEEMDASKRVYTRDQLVVSGLLDGEEIHIIVNHWPSRSGGEKRSSPFREAAGRLNREIMDSIYAINPNAKIISMGDYNDGPYNKSIKEGVGAVRVKENVKEGQVYNPFEQMQRNGEASLFYRDAGDVFDQIFFTEPFLRKDYTSFRYWKAGIFNPPFLIQKSGQYKGYPLRNTTAEPGFSDHFPVYIYLIKEVK